MAMVVAGLLSAVVSMVGLQAGAATPSDTLKASSAQMAAMPATTTTTAATTSTASPATTAKAASTTPAAAATTTVMIKNYAFSPAKLSVKVGDKVTWTNMDTAPHTVTVTSGPVKFNSGNLQKGESFSYTFTKAGTYSYYCAVHPDMKATVTVTGGTTTTPKPTDPTPTDPTMPTTDACGGALTSLDTFLQHVYAGHLEESLGDQVGDISDLNQYVKTHTVLVENMLKPLVGGTETSLDTFLQHVYAGHLEESLGDQVGDITDVNQYVKTHTTLVENMLKPLIGGSATC